MSAGDGESREMSNGGPRVLDSLRLPTTDITSPVCVMRAQQPTTAQGRP